MEVASLPSGDVAIRDSKHPDRPALIFRQAEWLAFLDGIAAGEFDFAADETAAAD